MHSFIFSRAGKATLRSVFVAGIVISTPMISHAAPITYDLTNVQLTDGVGGPVDGSLTGSFTYDASYDSLTFADITASMVHGSEGGFTYTLADSSVVIARSDYFELMNSGGTDVLFLDFSSALGSTSDTLSANSYEDETFYDLRNVASGSVAPAVTATPEPSSILLLGTGLLGVAGAVRKRFA